MHQFAAMSNHTEGNGRTGRSVALPDENRPSWRPQEDDRYEDDRHMRGHWEDRERRDWDRDRDEWRGGYGQGQSGYAAGRPYDDRSMGYPPRNQGYGRDQDERWRDRDRGTDDRWSGRGGSSYAERSRGGNMYREQTGYGSQPRESWGGRGAMGQSGMYGQGSSEEGTHGSYRGGGGHRGKGPANYQRSDERIREAVCEALTDDDRIDASAIEITVKGGEVTLAGTVEERHMKRLAEDVVEAISGVKDVQNQLRIGHEHKASEPQDRSKRS